MFGHTYYHGVVRKYVALFGTLFNEIYLNRYDPDSDFTQSVKVPINYGPREKVLARVVSDPELNKMPAIQLPRMTFEIASMSYASNRKLNTIGRRQKQDASDPNKLSYQYNPVPYDIGFTLSIIVKNADDGANIVANIANTYGSGYQVAIDNTGNVVISDAGGGVVQNIGTSNVLRPRT